MAEETCVFCKIVAGGISTNFLYETEKLVVFKDVHPSAPLHYLIIPREHYEDIEQTPDDVWVEIKKMAINIKNKEEHKGFRLGNNFGNAAEIPHMHVHYLSGIKKDRKL